MVSVFGRVRFTFFAAGSSLARRFSGLGWGWDSIPFGGQPAVLRWAGDSTAIPRRSMDMVSGDMVLKIMSRRKRTKVPCTCMAEMNAI